MHSTFVHKNPPSSIKNIKYLLSSLRVSRTPICRVLVRVDMNFSISRKNEYLQKRPIYTLFSISWRIHFYENRSNLCICLVFYCYPMCLALAYIRQLTIHCVLTCHIRDMSSSNIEVQISNSAMFETIKTPEDFKMIYAIMRYFE